MPISENRREQPGSLMSTIRQHAGIPDAYSWASLGITVLEARNIVTQIDLMHDRLERRARNEARLMNRLEALHAAITEYADNQDVAGDAPWVGDDLRQILTEQATTDQPAPDSRPSVSNGGADRG